jgi:hypothetical protein
MLQQIRNVRSNQVDRDLLLLDSEDAMMQNVSLGIQEKGFDHTADWRPQHVIRAEVLQKRPCVGPAHHESSLPWPREQQPVGV